MSKLPLFFLKMDKDSAFCVLTNDIPSISKSRIRNLQSIGRVLRKGENKNSAILYDIADDISNNDKSPNYTLNHLFDRIKIYNQENFDYEIVNIKFRK